MEILAMRTCFVVVSTVVLGFLTPARALAQGTDDPFLWLEEVEGERAMSWAEARNAETLTALGQHPLFDALRREALEILTSEGRIAYPNVIGEAVYNFWTDEDHPRGYYRRAALESYIEGAPDWETVLDIDALAAAEGIPWSFGGITCLPPERRRCMVRLSRGGSDAVEMREFDLTAATFVDGFFVPEAKTRLAWLDENTLLVATDFGEGSLTTSGYPRMMRRWIRGTPLDAAETIYTIERNDVGVGTGTVETASRTISLISHSETFYESSMHVLTPGGLVRLDIPTDADVGFFGEQITVLVRTPWGVGGRRYSTGSIVAMDFDRFLAGERDFSVVVEPGPRSAVLGAAATRDHLVVTLLDNVRSQLWIYRNVDGVWESERIDAPEMGTVAVVDTDTSSNTFFFNYSSLDQPTSLYVYEEEGNVQLVRQLSPQFDASALVVEQLHATSTDGTPVPYFVLRHKDLVLDGLNPTLLYAYGGFEVSETASYNAGVGKSWVERGGVYVVANIRGGGEFGPAWHRAGLKENRQRVYDDFLAVAQDLIARGITSPKRLGIRGGSNGGLLTGVAMTQRPDLFAAVVSEAPLLDMRRYNKLLAGASWMAEYGDPDIAEEWRYIAKYSPYQNVFADQEYPEALFTTTTRDDRVHPGHARKMAAKMLSQGHRVFYFENTEGGHGAGVTPEQRALMAAVTYTYLWRQLTATAIN
jgi:prolyl oligopeptidase